MGRREVAKFRSLGRELDERARVSVAMRTGSLSAALLLTSCTATALPLAGHPASAAPPQPAGAEAESDADERAKVEGPRPCEPDSDAYRAAEAALDDLDARLTALGPKDDPGPVNDELEALLSHECLALAPAPWSFQPADSVEILQQFWGDGGHKWLRNSLKLLTTRKLTFSPSVRATLTLESRAGHPLAAELPCPSDDADCGRETAGWRRRADRALREFVPRALRRRDEDQFSKESCVERALEVAPGERFAAARDCFDVLRKHSAALPLGRTRALDRGWLLVRGLRGHASFCNEVRLYDLASGAVYFAQSCGRPASNADGPTHWDEFSRGFVPVDNLREAVWMMVMSPETQEHVYPRGASFVVPDGIELVGRDLRGGYGMSRSTSSAQSQLAWSLMIDGEARASGELTWPTDYDRAAQAHAVELLAIAEAGFVSGCPRVEPPQTFNLGDPSPDARPYASELHPLERELFAEIIELGKQRPEKGCRSR